MRFYDDPTPEIPSLALLHAGVMVCARIRENAATESTVRQAAATTANNARRGEV